MKIVLFIHPIYSVETKYFKLFLPMETQNISPWTTDFHCMDRITETLFVSKNICKKKCTQDLDAMRV